MSRVRDIVLLDRFLDEQLAEGLACMPEEVREVAAPIVALVLAESHLRRDISERDSQYALYLGRQALVQIAQIAMWRDQTPRQTFELAWPQAQPLISAILGQERYVADADVQTALPPLRVAFKQLP